MLEELRKLWEKNLTVLSEKMVDEWTCLVVLTNKNGQFHCHRYFSIGNDWVASVDCRTSSFVDVVRWCFDPRAKPEDY